MLSANYLFKKNVHNHATGITFPSNFEPHKCVTLVQSTKNGTHENKAIHSMLNLSFQDIDGKKLLQLSRDQIVNLTGMRVGASLKISELIQKLKSKSSHAKVVV